MNQIRCSVFDKICLLLLAITIATASAGQQNIVSGVITDEETQEPIQFANVFFANTTIGVSSDVEGKFRLEGFSSGKYDLTVTFVGYNTFQQSFEFNGSEFRLKITLTQTPINLSEVIVKEDTTGWARNFITFKHNFLGETSNAKSCVILNPKAIHLYFDPNERILVGHAKEPIQIENKALGYKLNYYLHTFELDYRSSRLLIFGIPSFTNLAPSRSSQTTRWNKERLRAYEGSVTHFMRAFRQGTLQAEGFEVKELFHVPNPDRPPQAFLEAKIAEWRAKNFKNGQLTMSMGDSLSYYMKKRSLPELVDSISSVLIDEKAMLTHENEIHFTGMMQIDFKKEKEEMGYLRVAGRTSRKWQTSQLHFLAETTRIYDNGYYEDVRNLVTQNYWAWSEKISDLLSLDYQPPIDKKSQE